MLVDMQSSMLLRVLSEELSSPMAYQALEVHTNKEAIFVSNYPESITSSSGAVSQWNDVSSGSNAIVTQGVGASQPFINTRTINNLEVLESDGTNNFLTFSSNISLTGEFTILGVAEFDVVGTTSMLLGSGDNANNSKFGTLSSGGNFIRTIDGGSGSGGGLTTPVATPYIFTYRRDSANKVDFAFDGNSYTRFFSDAAQSGTLTLGAIFIDDETTSGDWDGTLGELLIFNRAITDSERQSILNYLSAKWGISI